MKKIFVLKGKSETGKTTKINLIAEWIINNYGAKNSIGLNPSDLQIDTHGILRIKNLTIGINSSGDDETEVRKVDKLVLENESICPDIIICSCRTRGKGRKYLINNYNYSTNWLRVFINVEAFSKNNITHQKARNTRILDELKSWLIGLEK